MTKYIQRKDGTFAGSLPTGRDHIPTPDPGRPDRRTADIPEAASYAQMYEGPYETYLRRTGRVSETPAPGAHPVYRGANWGVQRSDRWDDWSVNHGYYGSINTNDENGRVYIDGSPVPLAAHEVRWTADSATLELAETIWENRDAITAGLARCGFTPRHGVRIAIEPAGNEGTSTYTVRPYDRAGDFAAFPVSLPSR